MTLWQWGWTRRFSRNGLCVLINLARWHCGWTRRICRSGLCVSISLARWQCGWTRRISRNDISYLFVLVESCRELYQRFGRGAETRTLPRFQVDSLIARFPGRKLQNCYDCCNISFHRYVWRYLQDIEVRRSGQEHQIERTLSFFPQLVN